MLLDAQVDLQWRTDMAVPLTACVGRYFKETKHLLSAGRNTSEHLLRMVVGVEESIKTKYVPIFFADLTSISEL